MKRALAIVIIIVLSIFSLVSCQNAEIYYEDKVICLSVTHISGFDAGEEYYVYLEDIITGKSYTLPNGAANPYEVTATITKVEKEKITIDFSQPMDEDHSSGTVEVNSFELALDEARRFITPTCGGGDIFIFSIVDSDDRIIDGAMPH